MTFVPILRIAPYAVFAVLLLTACSKTAPYEFTTETSVIAKGTSTVDVRLKNTAAGTFVEDAVIAATHLDMAPDGMSETTSPVEPQGTSGPGVYRFKANFTMTGKWALSLSARVPGQSEPVTGTVVFSVK